MAFDYFAKDQDKEQQQNQAAPGQQLGESSPIVTGNAPAQNSGEGSKSSSGQFTNLQSYLDANKDQNFGSQVAGKVQTAADNALQQQQNTGSQFQNKVNQGSVEKDQGLLDQVGEDPTNVENDDAKRQSFEKMRDAKYHGPQHLSDENQLYQNAYGATDKAAQAGEQTKSEGGRKAYLQQEYGTGQGKYDYTQGQQNLDNLLIQNDPTSRTAFAQAQQNTDKAKSQFGQLQETLDQYAARKAGETASARAGARGAVGIDDQGNITNSSPIFSIQKAAEDRANALNKQKGDEYQQMLQNFSTRNLSDQDLRKTGIQNGTQLFVDPAHANHQFDLGQFLSSAPDLDRNQAATKDQQARVAALSKLAALDNTYLPYADRAGQYDPNQFNTFDQTGFQNTLAANKASYNDALNTPSISKPNGSFDVDSGQNGAPQDWSIPDALKGEGQAAAFQSGPFGKGGDTSAVYRYQQALQQLAELQKSRGFEDVVGGGTTAPGGDWSRMTNYGGFSGDPRANPVPNITFDKPKGGRMPQVRG